MPARPNSSSSEANQLLEYDCEGIGLSAAEALAATWLISGCAKRRGLQQRSPGGGSPSRSGALAIDWPSGPRAPTPANFWVVFARVWLGI